MRSFSSCVGVGLVTSNSQAARRAPLRGLPSLLGEISARFRQAFVVVHRTLLLLKSGCGEQLFTHRVDPAPGVVPRVALRMTWRALAIEHAAHHAKSFVPPAKPRGELVRAALEFLAPPLPRRRVLQLQEEMQCFGVDRRPSRAFERGSSGGHQREPDGRPGPARNGSKFKPNFCNVLTTKPRQASSSLIAG
jgi:hypothetical protein